MPAVSSTPGRSQATQNVLRRRSRGKPTPTGYPSGSTGVPSAPPRRSTGGATSSATAAPRKARRVSAAQRQANARQKVLRSVIAQKPVKAPKPVARKVKSVIQERERTKPVLIAPRQQTPLKVTRKAIRINPEAAARTVGIEAPKAQKAPKQKAAPKAPKPRRPQQKAPQRPKAKPKAENLVKTRRRVLASLPPPARREVGGDLRGRDGAGEREQARRYLDDVASGKVSRREVRRAASRVKPKKVAVAVPEIVPPQFRKAVAKQGQRLNDAVKGTGLTGPEYLAKLIQFESGWSPTAENPSSAYGLGQFIDSTAQDFRERLGVETQDPKKPRQMIKGAALHASGKAGYGPLYAGYNPGYSDTDPIPGVPSGDNVKVKIAKKAVKRVAGGDVQTGKALTTKTLRKKILSVIPPEFRSEGRGDKRTPAENAAVGGSATSDHLTGQTSYAADLPADDALARGIAKKLGMASHTGTNEVVRDGIRYQLIWQDAGHYDHVHLGARPATGVDATSSTGSSAASVGTSPGAPSKKPRKRAKRKEGKERSRLIRELIAKAPVTSIELPDAPTDTSEGKVELSL